MKGVTKMEKKEVRGYKVFNPDWTCRGFQYKVGDIFEEDVAPECCERGFHFCLKAVDCFKYYDFDPNNKVAEVVALGEVDYKEGDSKCCTNKIKIVREILWNEVLETVNIGMNCTGKSNTGDYNSGDYNTGGCNSGHFNTGIRNMGNHNIGHFNIGCGNIGHYNTGDYNTGDYNAGRCNTGYYNTGDHNAGDYNAGKYNTGDWNTCSHNTGCFMTEEQKIMMFNKPSDWTLQDWRVSKAYYLLIQMPQEKVIWVHSSNMTDEEKAEYPTHETTGGYLKVIDDSRRRQSWWNDLSEGSKEIIKSIPNFDAEIFYECTGIRVD